MGWGMISAAGGGVVGAELHTQTLLEIKIRRHLFSGLAQSSRFHKLRKSIHVTNYYTWNTWKL